MKYRAQYKKTKKLKVYRGILALASASIILLSGCYPSFSNSNITSDSSNTFQIEAPSTVSTRIERINPFTNIEMFTVNQGVDEFKDFIDGIEVKYLHSEYFEIDNILSIYEEESEKISHNQNIISSDGIIDKVALIEQINKNNRIFLDNAIFTTCVEKDSGDVSIIVDLIIEVLTHEIKTNPDINIEKLGCVLSNLMVFGDNSMINHGKLTFDYRLVLPNNPIQLFDSEIKRYSVLIHEIYHILQIACPCYHFSVGISPVFEDVPINPLYWTWFFEASAEKNMMNFTGNDPSNYSRQIASLENLSLSTILDPNVKVNQTENISLTHDMNKLFEQFGAVTEKERREIIEMMYAFEIIHFPPAELIEKIGLSSLEVEDYQTSLRGSVYQTLTKSFYRNLATSISGIEVSIQDVFYLMKTWELNIYTQIRYERESNRELYPEFLENYVMIQDAFFNLIAPYTNFSADELAEAFINFDSNMLDREYYLNWLAADKRDYIFSREDEYIRHNNPDIRSVVLMQITK